MKGFVVSIIFALSASLAMADKMPKDVLACTPRTQADCDNFWSRQSDEAQKFILSYKSQDRNAALTCYGMEGYRLTKTTRSCVQDLIGSRRSQAHCEKKGHELLSASMEKCRIAYRRKHGFPPPY